MYDAGKIVPGLILFVALLTSPSWYNAATGQVAAKPELEKPAQEKQCVYETSYMRAAHMEVLDDWRNESVRDGTRTYLAADGHIREKSLTGDCLRCHSDATKFCDECHNYTAVKLYCWDCHLTPKEQK
jgi:hypothetical protein